jgi:hypothetical protein
MREAVPGLCLSIASFGAASIMLAVYAGRTMLPRSAKAPPCSQKGSCNLDLPAPVRLQIDSVKAGRNDKSNSRTNGSMTSGGVVRAAWTRQGTKRQTRRRWDAS